MRFASVLVFLSFLFIQACASKNIQPSYGTPEETFATWRMAVEKLDYDLLLSCYSDVAREQMRHEIESSSQQGLKAMRDEAAKTDFQIEKVVYEQNRAYLRVSRRLRGVSDVEVVNMILERGTWKLLP